MDGLARWWRCASSALAGITRRIWLLWRRCKPAPRSRRHHVVAALSVLLGTAPLLARPARAQPAALSSTPVLASIPVGRFYPNVAPVYAADEQTGYVYLGMNGPRRGAGRAGMIGILDSGTGRLVHTVPLGPGEVDLAVDERRGFVFATSFGHLRRATILDPRSGQVIQGVVPAGAGHLRVLDGHSGAILRTLAIGLATTSVAVDERQGRVYVAHAGAVDTRGEYSGPGALTIVDERNNWALHRVRVSVNPMRLATEVRTQRLVVASVGAYGKSGKGLGRVSILDSTRL
jgi:hypothetical protein